MGGVSTDTRSSQAQYVSRTALDTGREGRLLRPIRAPPSPGHAVQQGQPKRRSHTFQPRASQPEMRPRRERGQLDVAASPGNQGHLLSRRLARHISRHMGESVARPRSLGLAAGAQPRLPTALHDQPASPPSAASRPRRPSSPLRGLPGASAACRPAPQSPARPAPCRPSPVRPTRTSARSTNPPAARPNGGPAAQLRPPADAPDR